MAVKTIAQIRARFEGNDKPTHQDFIDLIDTLENIRDLSNQAIATATPVTIVADQAARLALLGAIVVGARVKQTDNGLTYVKQQENGSLDAHWVSVGDSVIELDDVISLDSELNRKLTRLEANETTGRLGAKNFYVANPAINLTGADVVTLPIPGDGFSWAFRDQDFEIEVAPFGTYPPDSGSSVTCAIKNTSGGLINVTVQPGIIVNGTDFPITLDAGKWMMVTITCLARPDFMAPGADLFFMSWGQEG